MSIKDLRISAKLLDCDVKSTGDYASDGKTKLYALYDKMTKKRVTPATPATPGRQPHHYSQQRKTYKPL